MIEQSVVKHNDKRDRTVRRILRILQIFLLVLAVLALGFGFAVAGVFWDTDRNVFWQAVLNMLLLALPVVAVIAFLEWRIRKLCVEFDYIFSDNALAIWRITGNRRALWITVPADRLTLVKSYDELTDDERKALSRAEFACCNAADPRLTLLESEDATVGRKRQRLALLLEPNDELKRALQLALKRNRL